MTLDSRKLAYYIQRDMDDHKRRIKECSELMRTAGNSELRKNLEVEIGYNKGAMESDAQIIKIMSRIYDMETRAILPIGEPELKAHIVDDEFPQFICLNIRVAPNMIDITRAIPSNRKDCPDHPITTIILSPKEIRHLHEVLKEYLDKEESK